MVSEESGSKSNQKFIVEMGHEKDPSSKDLLTAILDSWNHFGKEYGFRLLKSMPKRIKTGIKVINEFHKFFLCMA